MFDHNGFQRGGKIGKRGFRCLVQATAVADRVEQRQLAMVGESECARSWAGS